jgi:hypothetical protein
MNSATSHHNNNSETDMDKVLERIQLLKVNFVAIDFDQTLIDIHTGGVWRGTAAELVPHVRPIFLEFISSALSTNSIHIAIVTFSKQPKMIKLVLEKALGIDIASKIVIRGMDKSWKYEGKGSHLGKQAHMASAVEELLQQPNADPEMEITKNTTLLIDDDQHNIRIALEDGVRAVWFSPNKPQNLYQDLISLI